MTSMHGVAVAIYVNDGEDRFFFGYQEGDPLSRAITFTLDEDLVTDVTAQGVPRRALEFIFEQLNVDAPTEPWAVQWRQDRHPSMSVGDVVIFGETAYALSRRDGWLRVCLDAKQIA
jgi:hypothetical protein